MLRHMRCVRQCSMWRRQQQRQQARLLTAAACAAAFSPRCSAQRQRGERGGVALADVAAAAAAALPQQVEQLAGLRRAAVVTATRLHWRTRRRQTYAGDLALTPQQRNIRALARVRALLVRHVMCLQPPVCSCR